MDEPWDTWVADLLYLVRLRLPADKEDSVQFPLEKPHSHEWSFPTVQSPPTALLPGQVGMGGSWLISKSHNPWPQGLL